MQPHLISPIFVGLLVASGTASLNAQSGLAGEAPATRTAEAQQQPDYRTVTSALHRFHGEQSFLGRVQGSVQLVFFAGPDGMATRFLIGRPADPTAASLHRVPILWTSEGDSLVVWWATDPDLEVQERADAATVLRARSIEEGPVFTPHEVRPAWQNPEELEPELRAAADEAGRGGSAELWLHVSEEGAVLRAQLVRSTGYRTLDEAALRLAPRIRFEPATLDGQPVEVWHRLTVGMPPAG